MQPAITNAASSPPTIIRMFLSSLAVGLFSFGGGVSAWMLREFVHKRRWLTEAEFLNDLAIARALPGTNVTNITVMVGYRVIGPWGAVAGLLGLLSGPFLLLIAIVSVYDRISGPVLDAAVDGAAASALGATGIVAIKTIRHAGGRWFSVAVMGGVGIAAFLFKVPLFLVAAIGVPVSVALQAFFGARHGR